MTSETTPESSTWRSKADKAADADLTALPRVRKTGKVPIKSWVPDLEGSVLEQATNLSNLPFAIRHVALMPDAHAGYGMPIGGVLFADGAVVPYAIGVDIGCGVVLVETDLTVETLPGRGPRPRPALRRRPGAGRVRHACRTPCRARRPTRRSGSTSRRRSRTPGSIGPGEQLGTLGGREPLPRGPARRGRPGVRDAPLGLAERSARRSATRSTRPRSRRTGAGTRRCRTTSWRTCRSTPTGTRATGRR